MPTNYTGRVTVILVVLLGRSAWIVPSSAVALSNWSIRLVRRS